MNGRDGSDGVNGSDGADGSSGANGANGADGSNGTDAPGNLGVFLNRLGRFESGIVGEGGAEVVAFDPTTDRIFVVNASAATVDVLDARDPRALTRVHNIDVRGADSQRQLGAANSVAVHDGLLAVAIEANPKTDPGIVALYTTADYTLRGTATVGALPDMLTFTPDGRSVLVANEGEPSDDYAIDPPGSITVVDVTNPAAPLATQVEFTTFDAEIASLRASGVRIYGPGATVAQDLEPEYIATDGSLAWVTLQENNALALLELNPPRVVDIVPLGLKDHSIPGNELDASDRDGRVNLRSWPIFGMYQPDTIALYTANGMPYLVTANEGDAREYEGLNEQARFNQLALDAARFPAAMNFAAAENLGRLRVTNQSGNVDADPEIEVVHAFGARSFSIWSGTSGELVFDSGNDFEVLTARRYGIEFNANNDESGGDSRSDDKGPEPEALAVGVVGGSTYAFVGLERIGGIMVYDISHPESPRFVQYVNFRNFEVDLDDQNLGDAGDFGPECIVFVSAADSPTGEPLLVVGNEVSGTTTVYGVVAIR